MAVCTGSLDKAGTLAEPSIILFGEHGDSGKRMLKHSRTYDVPFGVDQVDIFVIEAVSLGKLEKLWLGFNSDDEGKYQYVMFLHVCQSANAIHELMCKD